MHVDCRETRQIVTCKILANLLKIERASRENLVSWLCPVSCFSCAVHRSEDCEFESHPGTNSVVSQISKNINLASASVTLRACTIDTTRIRIRIYLLAHRNLLLDILRLPSNRRAALGLYVILTLWRGWGANQPLYALLHRSSRCYAMRHGRPWPSRSKAWASNYPLAALQGKLA